MEIHLQDERPISWNKFYSGMHWSKRKEEADRVHALVAANSPLCEFEQLVDICFYVGFDKRPLDPDNICVKLYIDGLIGRVIENDTIKEIRSVSVHAFKSYRPFITIVITEES